MGSMRKKWPCSTVLGGGGGGCPFGSGGADGVSVLVGAMGDGILVYIAIQVAQRDHGEIIIVQMGDIALEEIGLGVDPGVVEIGHAVESEHGDMAVTGLVQGPEEVVEVPFGAGSACGGNEQGIVDRRVVGRTAATLVVRGEFGVGAAAGKTKAAFSEYRHGFGAVAIAWVAKGRGLGDAIFLATLVYMVDIGAQFRRALLGDVVVMLGVVADFEAVAVERGNFFPGHIAVFVDEEAQAFGDIEGRVEAAFFEQGGGKGVLGFGTVVEGQGY